ncbi:histidine kinase [Brevirhabdus pacifica]|uniref:Histidine kinase n=1 Tax=Brevirhabdus pacifica TaxID=1267768 RepID=A0A1U7DH62_9RHOB|nr:DUF6446 family protein [Brevirhabdus pacifica]APX89301.1 histidine kinase [Brevirhabdus pacifica]OWU76666.1 histidine kinase [Loktanella sp. 22II-4b]PJJ86082.1 hypothetical protein CLV77_0615 [Brevirhabdus pacifica]
MTGKTAAASIVIAAFLTGISVWYLQLYYYYDTIDPEQVEIRLTPSDGGAPRPLEISEFEGIDATSSPLRMRGCFRVRESLETLRREYTVMPDPTPLVGPGWFECYDANTVGDDLESGAAVAFLGEKAIADGVDRVIAIYPDGRGYVWHQLNDKYQD